MNTNAYQSLIEDTLTYLKGLLPQGMEAPPKKQKLEAVSQTSFKKKLLPPRKNVPVASKTPPPVEKPQEEPTPSFKLEIPKTPPQESQESLRRILQEIHPDLFLHKTPPNDIQAQRIKNAWKEKRDTPMIPILFQGASYRPFVRNIAKAIDTCFGTCRLVEIETGKKWDLFLESPQLKLIIAPDHLIFESKELLPFYRENPQEKSRHLGNIPLLLLPDLSLYFKDAYLKRSLWNVICQNLQPLF